MILDVLAMQAPPSMRAVWSPDFNVRLERLLWRAVLAFHVKHGLASPQQLADYTAVIDDVRLDSIRERELVTRHDLKARLEEFNALAGHEVVHLGMTSADVVDNVALIKMRTSMGLVGLVQEAQRVPFRGIKGAIGTMQDQVDLLGSYELARELDQYVAACFGFTRTLDCVGQVYPRSIDYEWAHHMYSVCVKRWRTAARGYLTMLGEASSDQWNEGDVSTSVVRRVALPGIAYCAAISKEKDA